MINPNKLLLSRLGFYLIALCVLLVYWPSLFHIARGDQVVYLHEVAHQKDWFSLALGNYDLNRHGAGDDILFRPLLYIFLGTEKFFFGYNFLLWQLVGIVLHLVVVYWFLKLLLKIHHGFSAVLWTAFFALFYMNMELVIWHHLSSYLIFVVLMLVALNYVYEILIDGSMLFPRLWGLIAVLAPACFIYEVANLYSILFAAFLWFFRRDARPYIGWVLLPVGIYITASITNLCISNTHIGCGADPFHLSNIFLIVQNLLKTMAWWLYVGLFSGQYHIILAGIRTVMEKADVLAFKPLIWSQLSVILMGVGICIYTLFLIITVNKSFIRKKGSFIALIGCMVIIYCLVIVIGREQVRGISEVLRIGIYYMYIFWALILILLYSLLNFDSFPRGIYSRLIKVLIAIVFVLVIYFNSQLVLKDNYTWAKMDLDTLKLVNNIETLIKQNGMDVNFSFFVDDKYPGNYVLYDETKTRRMYTYIEVLYPQYVKPLKEAKYHFLVV